MVLVQKGGGGGGGEWLSRWEDFGGERTVEAGGL